MTCTYRSQSVPLFDPFSVVYRVVFSGCILMILSSLWVMQKLMWQHTVIHITCVGGAMKLIITFGQMRIYVKHYSATSLITTNVDTVIPASRKTVNVDFCFPLLHVRRPTYMRTLEHTTTRSSEHAPRRTKANAREPLRLHQRSRQNPGARPHRTDFLAH